MCLLSAAFVAGSCSSPSAPTPPPTVPDPPKVTCPAASTQVSPTGFAINVVYGSPSVSGGASPVTTSCTPVSGSSFSIGTTTVTCTATDTRQRTDTCTFQIAVQSPAKVALTRFLAFGDSITRGEDGSNPTLTWLPTDYPAGLFFPSIVNPAIAYPTRLQQLLAARYTTQSISVTNGGEPGEYAGTPDAVSRFRLFVRGHDVVLIMEGSNDIFAGDPSKIGPAITNLRSMIQYARSLGVRPYLATVPPMDPNGVRGRLGYATVAPLNNQLRSLAASEGVTLVDVNQAFGGNFALLSADGLHPNADGYERIATTFYDALKSTLETAAPAGAPFSFYPTFTR